MTTYAEDLALHTVGMVESSWKCPVGKPPDEPGMHCTHWEDCMPCCRCGDNTPDPGCDCPRCTAVKFGVLGVR